MTKTHANPNGCFVTEEFESLGCDHSGTVKKKKKKKKRWGGRVGGVWRPESVLRDL